MKVSSQIRPCIPARPLHSCGSRPLPHFPLARTSAPRLFLLLLLFALSYPARAQDAPAVAPVDPNQVVAFTHVNVIPMSGAQMLEDQTVLVRGDRITEVGPASQVQVPNGALRVEGRGKYLMPGLAEMHGHIPSLNSPQEYIEDVLFLFVANGITTVRGMQGAPGQLELREKANQGELISPTLYLAGPGFSGGSIDSPAQAAQRVREQHAEGWDLIKVLPGLTREEYDAMARTANEVGMRFAGHVPADVGLLHALEMGQETFDHLDGYIEHLDGERAPLDEAAVQDVVRRTREAGAWVVPTMVLWETLFGVADLETVKGYEGLQYMPPELVERWTESHAQRLQNPDLDRAAARQRIENRMHLLRALNEGGVRILMGTDAPQQFSVPGFSLHLELERMAEAGMTPHEIIASGTANVGAYFDQEDDFGTIEEGARADLLLLEANPLADISNVDRRAGVMVRGRWLPEAQIQARLAAIQARYEQEQREQVERGW